MTSLTYQPEKYKSRLSRTVGVADTDIYVDALPVETSSILVIDKDSDTNYEIILYAGVDGDGSVADPYKLTGCVRNLGSSGVSLAGGTGKAHGRVEIGSVDVHFFHSLMKAHVDGLRMMPQVANTAALPTSGNTQHDIRFVQSEVAFYRWNSAATSGSSSDWVALALASTPNASETVQGTVEIATDAQVLAGSEVGETTAPVVPTPAQVATAVQEQIWNYAVDASGTDDYVVTLSPAPAAYTDSLRFSFKAGSANTGPVTVNVNGLGAIAIKKRSTIDLETGDIAEDQIVDVQYNATTGFFEKLSESKLPALTGLSVDFLVGEDVLQGDHLGITAADTVKRYSPIALPGDVAWTNTATMSELSNNGGSQARQILIPLSSTVKVAIEINNASPGLESRLIPITPSTGAIGTCTDPFASLTAMASETCFDVVKVSSTHMIQCVSKADSFLGRVIYESGGTIYVGTEVTIDSTAVEEGFCDYISDSHVLFFARNTSGSSIDFYKYTRSSTTLTSSSTGVVSTLTGKTFNLKGVRRFGTTNYFLFIVQNATDGRAEAFIAHYDTATSSFDVVGSRVALTTSISLTASAKDACAFLQISDTEMIVASGEYLFLISRADDTSTVPVCGAIHATPEAGTATYCLSPVSSRAFLAAGASDSTADVSVALWEFLADRSDIFERVSGYYADAPLGTGSVTYGGFPFYVSPTKLGFITSNGGTGYAGIDSYTFPPSAGIASANADLGDTLSVTISGYCDDVSGLTAATQYYADIGGELTTDSSGIKVGITKDAAEIIVKS